MPRVQRQQWFLHSMTWDCWRRYFRYRGVVPAAPLTSDPSKHFIFVHVPHAVFPCALALSKHPGPPEIIHDLLCKPSVPEQPCIQRALHLLSSAHS